MSRRSRFFIPPANRLLGDRYELLECLGDGSHGYVWRAARLHDGKIVAIKIPKEQGASSDSLSEGRMLIDAPAHPNVIQVHWMDRVPPEREWYAIEMEYFPGQTLASLLEDGPAGFVKSFARIFDLYEQVLQGVHHLHGLKISHGDIKPHNILYSNDTVKITDFGSSLQPEEMYVRTRANGGTILYSAPEVLDHELTMRGSGMFFRADIYSLGVLFYHLLTGRTPHDTSSQVARHAPFPRPRELNKAICPAVEEFVLRCLAFDPDDRWDSLEAMLQVFPKITRQQLDYHTESPLRPQPEPTTDWSAAARACLQAGRFSEAAQIAREQFKDQREPHAFLLMLSALFDEGRFAECLRTIEAHPEFSDHPEVLRRMLDCFMQTRQMKQSAAVLDRLLMDSPDDLPLLLKKASVLGMEARYEEARDLLMDLNQQHPGREPILRRLILVHEQLREPEKANLFEMQIIG